MSNNRTQFYLLSGCPLTKAMSIRRVSCMNSQLASRLQLLHFIPTPGFLSFNQKITLIKVLFWLSAIHALCKTQPVGAMLQSSKLIRAMSLPQASVLVRALSELLTYVTTEIKQLSRTHFSSHCTPLWASHWALWRLFALVIFCCEGGKEKSKYKIFQQNIPGTWILNFLLAFLTSEIPDSELQNILSIL